MPRNPIVRASNHNPGLVAPSAGGIFAPGSFFKTEILGELGGRGLADTATQDY